MPPRSLDLKYVRTKRVGWCISGFGRRLCTRTVLHAPSCRMSRTTCLLLHSLYRISARGFTLLPNPGDKVVQREEVIQSSVDIVLIIF